MHNESHPLTGKTVKVDLNGDGELVDLEIEEWWDVLTGTSWMMSNGNPAALNYALRAGQQGLPLNDEVVYGKVDGLGEIVHVNQIKES